jgi:hypothetical protein
MAQTKLNVTELKTFITYVVGNNKFIQDKGKIPTAIAVTGDAGLGKTSAILEVGAELGLDVVKINLTQIEELGDLVGFPYKEFEMKKQDGTSKWVPESLMETYIKAKYIPTSRNRMSYAAPEWIEGKTDGGILLLDDFNRADNRFIQASMELIDRQTYISWKLPKNWHILLSQNPDNGDYNVNSQDGAQTSRYISVDVKFDADVWAKWAEGQGLDNRCINFILMNPEAITKEINSRAATTFFNAISSIDKFEKELPLITMVGEGSVGEDFTAMFAMFINNKMDKIISPKDILNNPNESYVVGALNSCIGTGDDFRADISSIVATRVVNYALVMASKGSIDQIVIDRIIKLTTDCDSFTDDLRYYIIKELVAGNKVKFAGMMRNAMVLKMSLK